MVQRIMLCLLFVLRLFEKKQKTTAVRRRFWGKNKTEQRNMWAREKTCGFKKMHNRGMCGPDKKLVNRNSRNVRTKYCIFA
jgi:hypothetical protein